MLHGSLSLPARLCLLSWDTATGEPLAADRLPYLVRAAPSPNWHGAGR